ncbi:MAG: hypothetical protein SFU84_00235 [Gemmatimonadales bacterium]|nr:hypothetical protein [Gemmatimonadales bacterium]
MRLLLIAVVVSVLLASTAAFGGPHGVLGAVPWLLNLPGILLVVAVPSDAFIPARVGLALAIQVAVWYTAFRWWHGRKQRRARADGGS